MWVSKLQCIYNILFVLIIYQGYWPGINCPNRPIIQPREIYNNVQLRASYLGINLLAWFSSVIILGLGLANVINFPSFSTKCSWLLQVSVYTKQYIANLL